MNSQNNQERIEFTQIASGLDDNILQGDLLRESGLKSLLKVRTAKQTGQKRELDRLSKLLGEKHARVTALSTKVEAEQRLVREVAVNLERSQIKIPPINENTWIFHGRVYYSKEITGVPNLTVGLYDQNGKWLEEFGYACTDNMGYFKLIHRFVAEKTQVPTESKPDTAASEQRSEIFIRLQDKSGVQVYIGKKPISPTRGKVEYLEIILGDESVTCIPPDPSDQTPISSAQKKPRLKWHPSCKQDKAN